MTRSFPSLVLALAVLAVAVVVTPPAVPAEPAAAAPAAVKRGNLFSAIRLADSDLGRQWASLRGQAAARFPDLRLARTEDLHITVVYIGAGWRDEDLGALRARMRVVPAATARLTPEVVRMGRNGQVVAVEQLGAPQAWTDSVLAAKAALNRLALKQADAYDTSFRTHVTLAEARHHPPSASDSTALADFAAWIAAKVAADPAKFSVEVGPRTRVALLLAGATRPEGSPEYVTVEEFLEAHEETAPAR
jgi:2'-5' RNA ligase